MRTEFTLAQLKDQATATSAGIIRKCVHCGFCTATCPTYALLGNELDSPRGRIYLIKDMLEQQQTPTSEVVKHIDRCLSCLSCTTTCPSGVDYMHLIDHARAWVEQRYKRPFADRFVRNALRLVLPYPGRLRFMLRIATHARRVAPVFGAFKGLRPFAAMLSMAPAVLPATTKLKNTSGSKGHVVLLQGCVEPELQPEVRAATVRFLERAGYGVTFAPDEGCCGALVHHLGREQESLDAARRNVDAWDRQIKAGAQAIIVTASGCGTMLKDYGFLLKEDPDYADKAARVSHMVKDVSQFLAEIELPPFNPSNLLVAYHGPCSLQHGQKVVEQPKQLLTRAGYRIGVPKDSHLCCGSAGTYNILQAEIARQLRDRKVSTIMNLKPDVIATSNVGCAMQIAGGTTTPVVHVIELLDWASGGPKPARMISTYDERNHS